MFKDLSCSGLADQGYLNQLNQQMQRMNAMAAQQSLAGGNVHFNPFEQRLEQRLIQQEFAKPEKKSTDVQSKLNSKTFNKKLLLLGAI
jgi:hypothetical protein